MIAPDERRRVAEWYRGLADEVADWGEANPWWYVMKGVYGDVARHDTNELFHRLADFIDPTCKVVIDQVDDGEFGAHELYLCCSNCGNQNMQDRFTGKPHNFCPNCGARVMLRKDKLS